MLNELGCKHTRGIKDYISDLYKKIDLLTKENSELREQFSNSIANLKEKINDEQKYQQDLISIQDSYIRMCHEEADASLKDVYDKIDKLKDKITKVSARLNDIQEENWELKANVESLLKSNFLKKEVRVQKRDFNGNLIEEFYIYCL